jgi:hypothetical protein
MTILPKLHVLMLSMCVIAPKFEPLPDLPPFFWICGAMAGYMDDDWLPPSEDEEEALSADIGIFGDS